jgi:hypothetical protein
MRRISCIAFLVSLVLAPAVAASEERRPPFVTVKSSVGSVVSNRGIVEVSLLGVYSSKAGLIPSFLVALTSRNHCSDRTNPSSCGSSYHSHSSHKIDSMIETLESSQLDLSRGRFVSRSFGRRRERCGCDEELGGSIHAVSDHERIDLTVEDTTFSVDDEAFSELIGQLKQARDIVAYLRPKFDAFNSAAPDTRVPITLDLFEFEEKRKKHDQ